MAAVFGAVAVGSVVTSGLRVAAAPGPAPANVVLGGSPSNFESGDGNMTVDYTTSGRNDADWNCVSTFAGMFNKSEDGATCSTSNNGSYFHRADPNAYTTSDISWVGGQKQDLDCPLLTNHKPPAKDTFTDVASYTEVNASGHTILYGGTIRYSANGSASENVELKHGGAGACSQVISLPGGSTTQLLARVPGDELLAFDYSGSGGVDLHVLTWIDTTNLTAGGNIGICNVTNDTVPCWGANILHPSSATFNGATSPSDIAAVDNGISGGCSGGPQGCTGTSVAAGAFAEFGVDLTAAGIVPANQCFSIPQTLWESRSSGSSFTSEPEDIEIENQSLNNCTSSTVTTPSAGKGGSVSIGTTASGSSADLSETDSATVTVTGVSTFGGSVDFHLCGPLALMSTSNCQTGGTDIGSTSVSGSGGTATVTSPTATVTKVGLYCWRANYTDPPATAGGQGIPGSSDPSDATSQTECFKVTPVTPTLTTSAAFTSGSQVPAAVTDTLTLSGTAHEAGTPVIGTPTSPTTLGGVAQGTITYTVYGPNSCTAVAKAATNVSVSGDGNYTASFTANQPGKYTFVAQYNGDSPNTNASAAVACTSQPASESVSATDSSSATSTQAWMPNDSATVTSGSGLATLSGTLTLQLYDGTTDCGAGGANDGHTVSGQLYSTTVPASSPQQSISVSSSNATFSVTASDSVSWLVTFTSNNSSVSGSTHCENTSLTIAN